ncbi:MAG TPA: DUF6220 domain-containing protein [Micromonosporaceae bacterium]|nr:DUF6220 domain-containing protein [Micromonosporaceae bacterium]
MSDSVKGLPAGYRTVSAQIMRILAMTTGTLAVAQFALAGYGAFGSFHKQRDWGAHETLGSVIGGFTLAVLIAAIVARPGRRHLIGATVLFVLAGPIQPILAEAGKNDNVFWGVLHALCGIAILAMCGLVSRKVDVTTAAPPTATPTPAAR